MPFINVKTNVPVSKDAEIDLKSDFGKAISAIPGKSEAWLMVGIEPEHILYFKGDDSPAAMVEVSVYGSANSAAFNKLTAEICSILQNRLSIDPSRIYVKYAATADWGWNGGNF
ncbi:MAG: hypothetical protein J6B75_10580 [Ruminococcus sp.]|nr:hypothetical protein [Ruminococcus sp.]